MDGQTSLSKQSIETQQLVPKETTADSSLHYSPSWKQTTNTLDIMPPRNVQGFENTIIIFK